MRNFVCWCLVAITLVRKTSAQGSTTWNCDTMRPNLSLLRHKEPSTPDTSPFRLSVKSTDTATESTMVQVQAGQSVTVGLSVRPPGEITGFILQARQVGSTEPQGTWSVPGTNDLVLVTQCGEKEKDTVVNKVLLAVKAHEMTWTAPTTVPEGYEVQLVGAAIDGSVGSTGEYWNLHDTAVVKIQVTTAVVVPEESNPGTNPGTGEEQGDEDNNNNNNNPQVDPQITSLDAEDEHDLLLETRMEQDYLQQKQADIAMENLQSETDNTMDEDRKRHEEEYKWEMEDYEKRMYEEEVRRQARIDAELRDKEEWEAEQYEKERQREEEEKRRKEQLREMLGDTLQEVDINEIGNGEKKTSAGHRQTSTYVFYTCFFIIIAALL